MKKPDLQNEKLERAARRLLETARAPGAELDRIVASPVLFEAVKARIKTEQRKRESKGFFGDWRDLPVSSRHKTAAALAVLTLFALAALGVMVATKQDSQTDLTKQIAPNSAEQIAPPEIHLSSAPVDNPPPAPLHVVPEITKTENSGREKHASFQKAVFQKAVFKNENSALPKAAPRQKNSLKRQTPSEPEGEFYALTYTGKPVEPGEHLKIIRAELSRSSLFALGVNLPIENDSEKIKTDLLVGADGIAKAIRFVK
jgi:hypothetical protein